MQGSSAQEFEHRWRFRKLQGTRRTSGTDQLQESDGTMGMKSVNQATCQYTEHESHGHTGQNPNLISFPVFRQTYGALRRGAGGWRSIVVGELRQRL